jgi:ribosomal protein L37AE/L43A
MKTFIEILKRRGLGPSKGSGDAERELFGDNLPKCPVCKKKTVSRTGKLCIDCLRLKKGKI